MQVIHGGPVKSHDSLINNKIESQNAGTKLFWE